MKILITILLGLVGIVALLLIIAFFLKRDFTIERSVIINKPKQMVFDYVKILRNQKNYSTWFMLDPNIKTTLRGTDGTVGAVWTWESDNKNVGKAEQKITRITEGERIDFELRFTEPFNSTDPAYTLTEALGDNQTKVTSVYHGKMQYPTNLMTWMIKARVGKDMETTLTNLKTVLEKQ